MLEYMPYWAPRGLECPPGPPFPASLVPREPFGEDVNRPIYTDGSCLGDPVEGSTTGGPLGAPRSIVIWRWRSHP